MNNFKASDKVWIYTSPLRFTAEQKDIILRRADEFLKGWESHGSLVKGEIGVLYDHFIVVIADDCDGDMCGRAQDAQIRFIKELGIELGLDLTNRMQLAYRLEESDRSITVKEMALFKKEIQAGRIGANTIVFNNMITTVGEFESKWEVPASESWHAQLL